ncbi:MAG: glycosyltransferase [Prevotella sp.]|jgi:glycosyltransferase involved in cell wall biosynthesis|nr:glycosyltransferase [Prevotella sp.]
MLDIVVPVYNEGGNIEKLLNEIEEKVRARKRIVIVYDFDEDDTLEVISSIKHKYSFSITLVKNRFGRGVLTAIKTGLKLSQAEYALVTMADLSDSMECVDKMYELAQQGNDLVCGSRYMRGGQQTGGPFLKKILSRLAGVSLRYLTNIPTHDVTNSFKLYKRTIIDRFEIESEGGFEIGMELAVKTFVHGFKIVELPTTWNDRTVGKSNFKMWRWMPRYLHWYIYCIKNTWFRAKHTRR